MCSCAACGYSCFHKGTTGFKNDNSCTGCKSSNIQLMSLFLSKRKAVQCALRECVKYVIMKTTTQDGVIEGKHCLAVG